MPCDMIGIKKITKKYKIKIIEDCSQAHGASINNKQVGSFWRCKHVFIFVMIKLFLHLEKGG